MLTLLSPPARPPTSALVSKPPLPYSATSSAHAPYAASALRHARSRPASPGPDATAATAHGPADANLHGDAGKHATPARWTAAPTLSPGAACVVTVKVVVVATVPPESDKTSAAVAPQAD
jgi:hypothetical protein